MDCSNPANLSNSKSQYFTRTKVTVLKGYVKFCQFKLIQYFIGCLLSFLPCLVRKKFYSC